MLNQFRRLVLPAIMLTLAIVMCVPGCTGQGMTPEQKAATITEIDRQKTAAEESKSQTQDPKALKAIDAYLAALATARAAVEAQTPGEPFNPGSLTGTAGVLPFPWNLAAGGVLGIWGLIKTVQASKNAAATDSLVKALDKLQAEHPEIASILAKPETKVMIDEVLTPKAADRLWEASAT